jgi:hypothetical protein
MGPGGPSPLQTPRNILRSSSLVQRSAYPASLSTHHENSSEDTIETLHITRTTISLQHVQERSPRPLVRVSSLITEFTHPAYQTCRLHAVLPGYPERDLILGRTSYLDAFSSYHFRRLLLSDALGRTTHTQALRPPRSSRTRGSLPQISFAHSG